MPKLSVIPLLAWVILTGWATLAAAQDAQTPFPQSFLTAQPSIAIFYGPNKGCPQGQRIDTYVVAGACYNFYSTLNGAAIDDNLQCFGITIDNPTNIWCTVFSDYDCFGDYWSLTQSTDWSGDAMSASSVKCGTESQTSDELMLITSKVRLCADVYYGSPCSIVYPYLTRCYDLSKFANLVESVQHGIGISCRLFSESGCVGSFIDVPFGGSTDLSQQGFSMIAVSFMCSGAL